MPQYITIKNFGPITFIERMEVKDFMLFIGERATGKSTIAKLIQFFNTIDYVIAIVLLRNAQPNSTSKDSIEQVISSRLKRYYPSYLLNNLTQIKYYFNSDIFIEIAGTNDSFKVEFSDKLTLVIEGLRAYTLRNSVSAINSDKEIGTIDILLGSLTDSLREQLSTYDNVVYFPSQRPILAPLEWNNIQGKANPRIDEIQDQFIAIKSFVRRKYYNVINAIENNHSLFYSYIAKVLNGQIHLDRNIESMVIKLASGHNIQIEDASSGQQETFWILLILASYISEERSVLALVEEPEAGLDPKTQSLIMEAIVAFSNHKVDNKFNQVIITTHSPFILNTLGNILYASKLSKEHEEEREELAKLGFTPELLLDPERVAVYKCINGGVESIMEDGRVNNEEIDNISTETLNALDSLIDIELKYENEV